MEIYPVGSLKDNESPGKRWEDTTIIYTMKINVLTPNPSPGGSSPSSPELWIPSQVNNPWYSSVVTVSGTDSPSTTPKTTNGIPTNNTQKEDTSTTSGRTVKGRCYRMRKFLLKMMGMDSGRLKRGRRSARIIRGWSGVVGMIFRVGWIGRRRGRGMRGFMIRGGEHFY